MSANSSWDYAAAARASEQRWTSLIETVSLPSPNVLVRQVRTYLQRMTDTGRVIRGPRSISHLVSVFQEDEGYVQINVGPTIFKEPCEDCIRFRSGAQLSFGLTVRQDNLGVRLISYRFYLDLLNTSGLRFVRIDLNPPKSEYDPLHIPRSHIHTGFEGIHLPFPVMHPLEVLDRIFHVIEPHFTH